MDEREETGAALSRPWRLAWAALLACVGTVAAAAGWILPGGFPVAHPRFWSNSVTPVLVLFGSGFGLWALWAGRTRLLRGALVTLDAMLLSASVVSLILFPASARWVSSLALAAVLAVGAAACACFRRVKPPRWFAALNVAVALSLGALLPWTQRAPRADPRPLNVALAGTVRPEPMLAREISNLIVNWRAVPSAAKIRCS